MTKALGERYLEEHSGALAVSVVRPSIIESALERPFPGWIEGFKMAEPIILAFGRGELPDFPAAPDGIIDIVPVDIVVNAIIAAAATPPPPGEPAYYQVCSGTRNPLLFRDLYRIVRAYFGERPMEKRGRGGISTPVWSFAGSAAIEGRLSARREGRRRRRRRCSRRCRPPSRVRKLANDVDQADAKLRFLRRYTDLYRPYTQAELVYDDSNTAALHDSLDPPDQQELRLRPGRAIEWEGYLRRHCDADHRVDAGDVRLGRAPATADARRPVRRPARCSPSSTSTGRWCRARSSSPTCGCGCPAPPAAACPASSRASPATPRAGCGPSAPTAAG